MPGSTLPNMSIVLPALGGDSGIWDDEINAALTLIDAHDHTSGKGPLVPTAGLNINADLTFAGNAATNLGKAAFSAVTALSSGSKTLFVSSSDNELYWRTNGGTNVKLTSGTTINTSLVGGIGGDYASVGAIVAYDDANDVYTFKQQTTNPWARIASGPVRIHEFNTVETVFVQLAIDAALASSYTLTFPAALPGSTSIVQVSSAGAISYSNTVANAVTMSSSLTVGTTLGVTGAATLSSTLGVTGLITATAGLTAAANQDITVSGTGAYNHGDRILTLLGTQVLTGGFTTPLSGYQGSISSSGAATWTWSYQLIPGDRVKALTVMVSGDSSAQFTNLDVLIKNGSGTTSATIGTYAGTFAPNGTPQVLNAALDLTDTVLANAENILVGIIVSAANAVVYSLQLTYDHP